MRSKLSVVCVIALLSTFLIPLVQATPIPVVQATPSTTASGKWTYVNTGFKIIKQFDGYQIASITEDGTWTGTFVGTSKDVIRAVINPQGFLTFAGLIYFTGTVGGRSGTLVILFTGSGTFTGMSGNWFILSGTGGLAKLRGQGTWWGPSYNLDYSGKVHFELR